MKKKINFQIPQHLPFQFHMTTQEDEEKARIRSAKIQKTREGLQKSSHWSQYFKNLAFEKERIAELKIQEYMRQRLERDKQLEL